MTAQEKTPLAKNEKTKISYAIGKSLHEKVSKHVRILKCLNDKSLSKQQWMLEAINQKLSDEEEMGPDECSRGHFLNMDIDEKTNQKLEKRVQFYKKFRKSYSKKQWLLEAIYEKLEKEAPLIEELLSEMQTS